jgi:hypothetical protein
MFKLKLLAAGLFSVVLFTASANAQTQLGANQIWGNPTAGSKPSQPSNIGSFLTAGTGVTVTGTPKATIGLATQIGDNIACVPPGIFHNLDDFLRIWKKLRKKLVDIQNMPLKLVSRWFLGSRRKCNT